MTKNGKSKVSLDDGQSILNEGYGAFVDSLNVGDKLSVWSVGEADVEVFVLDGA